MTSHRRPERRRGTRFSPFFLAVALSPALFQTGISCRSGDTTLTEFELIVDGQNRIANFDPDVLSYSAELPLGTDEARVRTASTDPEAQVWVDVVVDGERFRYLHGGLGGGDLVVPLPRGSSTVEAWVRAPKGATDYYSAEIQVGGEWSTPTVVLTMEAEGVDFDRLLDLAVNSSGDFAVAWNSFEFPIEYPSTLTNNCILRYPGFYVACDNESGSGTKASRWYPPYELGIDESGTGVLMHGYIFSDASTSVIVSRFDEEGTDGASFPSGFGSSFSVKAQMAVGSNGEVLVTWEDQYRWDYPTGLWAARFNLTTGGWETQALAPEVFSGSNQADAVVALGPNGDGMVLWNDSGEIWSRRYLVGSGWQTAEIVGTGDVKLASLVVDSAGTATMVCDGWSRQSTVSGGWGPSMATSAKGQLEADDLGGVIAVWDDNREVWASRFTPSNGWGMAQLIGLGFSAHLAVAPQGDAIVVGSDSAGLWWNWLLPSTGWIGAERIDGALPARPGIVRVGLTETGKARAVWAAGRDIWSSHYE